MSEIKPKSLVQLRSADDPKLVWTFSDNQLLNWYSKFPESYKSKGLYPKGEFYADYLNNSFLSELFIFDVQHDHWRLEILLGRGVDPFNWSFEKDIYKCLETYPELKEQERTDAIGLLRLLLAVPKN